MSHTEIQPSLENLRDQLGTIHGSIANFHPLITKPAILDSSVEAASDDDPWLQQEVLPGLKILRQSVARDLQVLEQFLADPQRASLPALSTNAPYLIAVWHEVLCAPRPLTSLFKSFNVDNRAKLVPGVKVDVVADHGRCWIRVNTVKNSRMLAEFREMDSYLTSSSSESDSEDSNNKARGRQVVALNDLNEDDNSTDNSVLRMGRVLMAAAKANPVQGTNEIPRVTLRLTRLNPSGDDTDPRMAQTIDRLRDMGIDVQLGERPMTDILPASFSQCPSTSTTRSFTPTHRINLDLSVLIALVSDLTHSPLPLSADEANTRFIPGQKYREWKKERLMTQGKSDPACFAENGGGSGEQARALTAQLTQEMRKGLLQEMRERLLSLSSGLENPSSHDESHPRPLTRVEFWTTEEARDRCLKIVSKIGGINEKRRVSALFGPSDHPMTIRDSEGTYWEHSRYPARFLPLIPIRLYSVSDISRINDADNLPTFFKNLSTTCRHILAQETVPDPRSRRESHTHEQADAYDNTDTPSSSLMDDGEIQRAAVTRVNPRLTAHTVKSMLCGAALGWTTLTANRSSVKAILKKMHAAGVSLDGDVGGAAVGGEEKAAIWVMDPRSLAEGMRSDV